MAKEREFILYCQDLTACYKHGPQYPVLKEVNIEIRKGEITGLLGPNGSGKSSTLNAMVGVLHILHGSVYFNNRKINHLTPEKIIRKGLRLFPQGGRIFSELTVEENLEVVKSCIPQGYTIDKDRAYKWFPDLTSRSCTRAGLLSAGQKQMLSLGMVLLYMQIGESLVFLLDEPSGSLDPLNRKRLAKILHEGIEHYGITIILAEENAVFAKEVCERFYHFVEPGRIEFLGLGEYQK